jgi:hypothetical protein
MLFRNRDYSANPAALDEKVWRICKSSGAQVSIFVFPVPIVCGRWTVLKYRLHLWQDVGSLNFPRLRHVI